MKALDLSVGGSWSRTEWVTKAMVEVPVDIEDVAWDTDGVSTVVVVGKGVAVVSPVCTGMHAEKNAGLGWYTILRGMRQ